MNTYSFVFQSDSDVVNKLYSNNDNYLIEYNALANENYCALYFSSNDLYYPNNELAFNEQLVKKNRYEWYGTRINYASKHIFLRDVKKQWYLTGINATLDTPQKLSDFLKKETEGYKVIALGSSAGGFASVIHGQLLNAEKIYTFNGQYEIISQLKKSSQAVDPVIFRNADNKELIAYYDAANFIKHPSSVYYFQSCKNQWDNEQNQHIKDKNVNRIRFKTTNHGIPFLRTNLPVVLNLKKEEMDKLVNKVFNPLFFSIKMVGVTKTITGIKSILKFALNKVYIKTILKIKQKITTHNNHA